MKRLLFGEFLRGRGAVGLLAVRLVVGAAFVLHGLPKIQTPFGWMGADAPVPGVLQALAALSEFGGGVALILGLLTPMASFGIACTMLVAIFMAHVSQGHSFVASKPGEPSFELAAVYLAIVILLMLVGPGALSLDALLFGKTQGDTKES
jgi:putative oxidoreductase